MSLAYFYRMPRSRRNVLPGEDVHTIFRSIDNSFLFSGKAAQMALVWALFRMKKHYNAVLYAWVGMSNHHHIFNQAPTQWPKRHKNPETETSPFPIGNMFRDCFSLFARRLNQIRERVGGVIRDRTKTVKMKSDYQAISLLIYIFLNPIRAGITKHPKDYPFHNFNMYAFGKGPFLNLFTYHPAYMALGKSWKARQQKFCSLLEKALSDWTHTRWCGASASHGVGRNKKKVAYEEFVNFAESWMFFALRNLKRAPPPNSHH